MNRDPVNLDTLNERIEAVEKRRGELKSEILAINADLQEAKGQLKNPAFDRRRVQARRRNLVLRRNDVLAEIETAKQEHSRLVRRHQRLMFPKLAPKPDGVSAEHAVKALEEAAAALNKMVHEFEVFAKSKSDDNTLYRARFAARTAKKVAKELKVQAGDEVAA